MRWSCTAWELTTDYVVADLWTDGQIHPINLLISGIDCIFSNGDLLGSRITGCSLRWRVKFRSYQSVLCYKDLINLAKTTLQTHCRRSVILVIYIYIYIYICIYIHTYIYICIYMYISMRQLPLISCWFHASTTHLFCISQLQQVQESDSVSVLEEDQQFIAFVQHKHKLPCFTAVKIIEMRSRGQVACWWNFVGEIFNKDKGLLPLGRQSII